MKKGEIWFVEIPGSNGREQRGVRPAVLISEVEGDTIIAVPFTSNLRALKYPHTLEINPSEGNGLKTISVALVFQLRAMDIMRLSNKIGDLEEAQMNGIDRLLMEMLKL